MSSSFSAFSRTHFLHFQRFRSAGISSDPSGVRGPSAFPCIAFESLILKIRSTSFIMTGLRWLGNTRGGGEQNAPRWGGRKLFSVGGLLVRFADPPSSSPPQRLGLQKFGQPLLPKRLTNSCLHWKIQHFRANHLLGESNAPKRLAN